MDDLHTEALILLRGIKIYKGVEKIVKKGLKNN
jgi:hypothetical protein